MPRLLPTLPETVRGEFIAAVRSLDGVPFEHKGRTERGVDCVGLCVYGLAKIGVACEDLADYSSQPDGVTLQVHVEKHLGPPVKRWRPGDIVLMRWHENKRGRLVYANHVAVLALAKDSNRWTIVHSIKETVRERGPENRVKEVGLAGQWPRRVLAVYSLTGAN